MAGEAPDRQPVIMFACIHNSGRSVAAKLLAERYGAGRVQVRSGGSEPGEGVNPAVAQVLGERGLDTSDHVPSLLTYESVESSDVVVTMGCGEACPVFPGKRYEDWQIDDPKGQDLETVRGIVADIERRVSQLIDDLLGAPVQGTITCPSCGAASTAPMPVDACQHFYRCPACDDLLRPLEGDCCVFCSYGNVRCPPKTAELHAEADSGD